MIPDLIIRSSSVRARPALQLAPHGFFAHSPGETLSSALLRRDVANAYLPGLTVKFMRYRTISNGQFDRAAIGLTKDAVESQSLAGQYGGGIDNTMRDPILSGLSSWILAK